MEKKKEKKQFDDQFIDEILAMKKNNYKHNFKYSHTEYPPNRTYSSIPPNIDVVICAKCGLIVRTEQKS